MGRKTVEMTGRRTEKTPATRTRWSVVRLALLWVILTFNTLEAAQAAEANRLRPTPRRYLSVSAFRSSAVTPLALLLLLCGGEGNMKDGCTTRMSPRTVSEYHIYICG